MIGGGPRIVKAVVTVLTVDWREMFAKPSDPPLEASTPATSAAGAATLGAAVDFGGSTVKFHVKSHVGQHT